jgi:hypothetical protein
LPPVKKLLPLLFAAVVLNADPSPPPSSTSPVISAGPVTLTGANGRDAEFAGIWEARPTGLAVAIAADGPLEVVPWTRFDLTKLMTAQPAIWAGYRLTKNGLSVPLNLGLFADLLTPPQVGAGMRRTLDAPASLRVPAFFHHGSSATDPGPAIPPEVRFELTYLLVHGPAAASATLEQNGRAYLVDATPLAGPVADNVTVSLRQVLELMVHTDGVPQPVCHALLELCKTNPDLTENAARQLDQIRTQLPPVRFLPNDPTLQTLGPRLTEAAAALRSVTAGLTIDRAQQDKLTTLLALAADPGLQ